VKRTSVVCSLIWLSFLITPACFVIAQQSPSFPNWQSLSVSEFATAVQEVYKARDDEFLVDVDERTIRKHAASLYEQIDLDNTTLSEKTVNVIHGLAYPELDEERNKQDLETILARRDDWAGKSYDAARARFSLLQRLRSGEPASNAIIKAWAKAGGDLSEIWTEDMLHMREVVSGWEELKETCEVVFQGQLVVPTTGRYAFSIPAVNVSARYYKDGEQYDLHHSVKLTIEGATVLNSTPEDFVPASSAVQLTGGVPVDLKLECKFETSNMPMYAASAILLWSGPGINTTVIAPEYFGDGQGLQMTHRWANGGPQNAYSQTVANIDWAWTDGVSYFTDSAYQAQISDILWQRTMAPSYLADCEKRGLRHPFLAHPEDAVESQSTARCTQFLNEVLARPSMLQSIDLTEIRDVYRSFRLRVPNKALDVLGLWTTLNTNYGCRMPLEYTSRMKHYKEYYGFDYYNQKNWRFLAQCVAIQSPEHAQRLEEEYLVLSDGRCNVPVSRILSYVYSGQGKHNEWIDKIAKKTNNHSLSGDQQASWYLAATQAHEMRMGPHHNLYAGMRLRPMDGLSYLDTAFLLAEDADLKVHICKERAARYSALRKFDMAREVIQQAQRIAPTNDLNACLDCISRFENRDQKIHEDQARDVKQAYVDRLKKRLQKALSRGDSASVERYNRLIQEQENR